MMNVAKSLLFVGLLLLAGRAYSLPEVPDRQGECHELLRAGERLIRIADSDRHASGAELLREAGRRCVGPELPPELRVRALLAASRVSAENRSLQLELRRRAVSISRSEMPEDLLLPVSLEAVADSQLTAGEVDEAILLSQEALEERGRLFGLRSREYVRGLIWVGVVYESIAAIRETETERSKALAYHEQAYELSAEEFGPHDPTTIAAAIELVGSLRSLERFAEAERLLEEIGPFVDQAEDISELP